MARTPRPDGHPFYRLTGMVQVTAEQRDFMRRRIGGLLSFSTGSTPLIDLLANAYMIGVEDAVATIARRADQGATGAALFTGGDA